MAWKLAGDVPSDAPGRPPLTSHQSSSLPSTPYQRMRDLDFPPRSPSPPHGNTSPRSTHSETTHLPPSSRKPLVGCKYETAMAYFRRRMPYSLGGDLLTEAKEPPKRQLEPEAEKKLTADMMELYEQLLPSAESDDRRQQLVRKLEKLFNNQWPGHDIKVHIFGSSGNRLCSSDSDVDICITTPWKELEHVCLLAEVLAQHGMERVVCVSHAKVPIVKIWDPELRLACDMNVNNTLALENTRMIRTYAEIDERVRPLAMITKYWTKQRILSDAGLGGTLSSYTWICLIINFLQTRSPPILPSLQTRPHQQRTTADGLVCSFDDNLDALKDYGRNNKQTLGELLFHFFRYYGHELNYERNVISAREGRLISKEAKGWHLLQNNRLCVEEPFNTSRNLGNTADDTSFRGVHLELRRAFDDVAQGNLKTCCEQYEFPPTEERCFERPPPQPRPTLSTPSQPHRGGRGGGRGGRSNQTGRGGYGRRLSYNRGRNSYRHGHGSTQAELNFPAQQAQNLLHDQLYQQIQILQAQEQELRKQLQNQALLTGRSPPVFIRQPFIQFPVPQQQDSAADENSRSRSGTINYPPAFSTPSNQVYYNPGYLPFTVPGVQGSNTNPPSPTPTVAIPELRRSPRRTTTADGSPRGPNRAHSQPARPWNSAATQYFPPLYTLFQHPDNGPSSEQANASSTEGSQTDEDNSCFPSSLPNNISRPTHHDERQQPDYMGYYPGSSPQMPAYSQNSMASSGPVGLALQQNGLYSFITDPQEYISLLRANEPPATSSEHSNSDPQNGSSQQRSPSRPAASGGHGPFIVDGSVPLSENRPPATADDIEQYTSMSQCPSTSDEPTTDTPASTSDGYSQDFQDNGSADGGHGALYVQPPLDTYPLGHSVDGADDNRHTGPSLLSSRLQSLYFSDPENLTDPFSTASENQELANPYQQRFARETPRPSHVATAEKGTQASGALPVLDWNALSAGQRGHSNGVNPWDKVNGTSHKTKLDGRPDFSIKTLAKEEPKDWRPDTLRKPNGTGTPSSHSPQPQSGGWQTMKKKSKRNKSLGDFRPRTNGVEPLPANESLRKGG